MSFLTVLYSLFIAPLRLLFELFFYYAYKFTGSVGLSIVVISLIVNLLVLPLYKHADEIQAEERDVQASMAPMLKHIKKVFRGDERFMMIQEYYRINNYKPIYALKSTASLFLQIPFFIAAYSFLSELKLLQGISLGPVQDLGSPDSLIRLGSISINALPVLMTLINIVSVFIYNKKGTAKDNVKLIAVALVFLVLLYNSPAGLVFYWTLNNVFSLVKNIIARLIKNKPQESKVKELVKLDKQCFLSILLSCGIMAVLTGIMIPADVIVRNPSEMTNMYTANTHSPVLYIVVSALTALGTFVIWVPVFAFFTKDKGKKLSKILPGFAAMGMVNYFFFNKNFGLISNKLIYERKMSFEIKEIVINLLVVFTVCAAVILVAVKFRKFIRPLLAVSLLAVVFLSVIRVTAICIFMSGFNYYYNNTAEEVDIPLTTTGQNVVVIMLDKMNGTYVPYLLNERPDVAASFDGFTYYPNTVSFGKYTNFGTPALFGGYDYTPERINARADESLVSKQNEALLTLPVLFSEEGWNVTVADPSYANYQWIPDLSIYDGYEGINAYNMTGAFNGASSILEKAGNERELRLNRNLFCYGLTKAMPYLMQPVLYTDGDYFYLNYENISYSGNSLHVQYGLCEDYVQEQVVLESLKDVTNITSDSRNCFFVISNCATHDVSLLKEPEYTYDVYVDNTEYDALHEDRFTIDGVTMHMDTDYRDYAFYQSGMAAFIALGNWFDYLRENGLYDNTRIIIVADHGSGLGQFDDLIIDDIGFDAQAVNPVLMVKDFNSTGFTVSENFMTNADTPSLALDGVVEDPVHPFTNNPIGPYDKSDGVLIYSSEENNTYTNNGTRFEDPYGYWVTVHDNIFNKDNWSLYSGEPN